LKRAGHSERAHEEDMICTFEEAMERRMHTSKTEATREVLALVRAEDMYIGDAVSLVIESLPPGKTAQLRRWNDSWEEWCEWLEWKDEGWEVREISSSLVKLLSRRRFVSWNDAVDPSNRPSNEAVAAAVDAVRVGFLGTNSYSSKRDTEFLYKVH
jgi:hypothetical protein